MSYRRLRSDSSDPRFRSKSKNDDDDDNDDNDDDEDEVGKTKKPDSMEKTKAAFVLAGSCSSLAHRNGDWDGVTDGILIQSHIHDVLGGIESLEVCCPPWRISEEVVMQLAVTNALVEIDKNVHDRRSLLESYRKWLSRGAEEIKIRRGVESSEKLAPREDGNAAAVAAVAVGLRFPSPTSLPLLVALSVQLAVASGQEAPLGFLGAVASASFAAAAVRGDDLREWGWQLVNESMPATKKYLLENKRSVDSKSWRAFDDAWRRFLQQRGIETKEQCERSSPRFPTKFGVKERDNFYKLLSFGVSPAGSAGHDSTIIAYDALLGCGGDWIELLSRSCFHGGARAAPGCIAGALFGAYFGFDGVERRHLQGLEMLERLVDAGQSLFALAEATTTTPTTTTTTAKSKSKSKFIERLV